MGEDLLSRIGDTPLVPLRRIAAGSRVPVLAKCEHLNPGGSVKDRLALAVVEDAERRGQIKPGDTLIEATAGNTGLGLGLVAATRGYSLVCVLPEKMSIDKRRMLASIGATVIVTPNAPPHAPENFQNVARRLAEERGWFLTDQFRTPVNAAIHESTTGPEIVRDGGPPAAFVAGVGTGGTLTGVARYLARAAPAAQIVLADPIGSALGDIVESGAPRGDKPYLVEGIGASVAPVVFDPSVVSRVERVSDEESFAMALRLHREEGLWVGGSAGTAVVAALRVARDLAPGSGPVVVVLPDAADRYRSRDWWLAGATP